MEEGGLEGPNFYIFSLHTLWSSHSGRKSKRERNGHVPRGVLISTQQPCKTMKVKERGGVELVFVLFKDSNPAH